MKRIFLIIVVFTSFFCCTPGKKINKFNQTNSICLSENQWIAAFKNGIVYNILEIKYKKELYTIFQGDITIGGIHDILNYDSFYIEKIKEIAIVKCNTHYFNLFIEKRPVIIGRALEFRVSKELDSIANFYYSKYKADSITHEKHLKDLGY